MVRSGRGRSAQKLTGQIEATMRETSTHGLRLDQMAALFSLSRSEPDLAPCKSDPTDMATLLREHLMCPLPKGSVFCEVLITMMSGMGYDTRPLQGRCLGDLLFRRQSDAQLLQAVKDSSKAMSSALDSRSETALATTVYYASLASALANHDRKITQHSYERPDESFTLLMDKEWMASQLKELFARAQAICQKRRGAE